MKVSWVPFESVVELVSVYARRVKGAVVLFLAKRFPIYVIDRD